MTMKTSKHIRLIKGIILHPFKSFLFAVGRDREHYNKVLSLRAELRYQNKQADRIKYITSIIK